MNQSVVLLHEVIHDICKFWYLSEANLLNLHNPYVQHSAGKGLVRVLASPSVGNPRDVQIVV